MIKGKLMYLAPEQLTGEAVDHRLDLYALGLCSTTLSQAFRLPVRQRSRGHQEHPDRHHRAAEASQARLPEELDRIVMKCLDKNVASATRAQRPSTPTWPPSKEAVDHIRFDRPGRSIEGCVQGNRQGLTSIRRWAPVHPPTGRPSPGRRWRKAAACSATARLMADRISPGWVPPRR